MFHSLNRFRRNHDMFTICLFISPDLDGYPTSYKTHKVSKESKPKYEVT